MLPSCKPDPLMTRSLNSPDRPSFGYSLHTNSCPFFGHNQILPLAGQVNIVRRFDPGKALVTT